MKTAEPVEADKQLDEIIIQQLTWKPDICRNIAVRTVEHFLRDRICYTDEIDFKFVPALSANCIGMTFRRLREAGIIQQTGRFRQSDRKLRPDRRSSSVFQWRLVSQKRAATFLERNGFVPNLCNGQAEMFPEVAKS